LDPPSITISPRSLPDWAPADPNDEYVRDGYTQTALHETIHLAAVQGIYDDRELADAVFHLEGARLSQAERDEYKNIKDGWDASGFWDKILRKNCH
jgi:hypothetical protein